MRPSNPSTEGTLSRRKRSSGKGKPAAPQAGIADGGAAYDPKSQPVRDDAVSPARPAAAPAPGVPMPADEYERLKEEARRIPLPQKKDGGQRDPSGS